MTHQCFFEPFYFIQIGAGRNCVHCAVVYCIISCLKYSSNSGVPAASSSINDWWARMRQALETTIT